MKKANAIKAESTHIREVNEVLPRLTFLVVFLPVPAYFQNLLGLLLYRNLVRERKSFALELGRRVFVQIQLAIALVQFMIDIARIGVDLYAGNFGLGLVDLIGLI